MTLERPPVGHGIGLRTAHYTRLLEEGPASIDWFEIISENFFEPGGRPWAVLERVRRDVPVVAHGVSLGIGDTDPIDAGYIASLRVLIDRVEPAWVSDHLCWGAVGGHRSHDLLPLPYTEEALAHVIGRVCLVQERLGRRIALENVSSYVAFRASAMPEWEFISEVALRADCGILLDVNNVYVSAKNLGFDAAEYIDRIAHERVVQIHLAGHSDRGTFLFDTHVGPVPDPVWDLYRRAVRRCGAVPTLVEWDDAVPPLDVVAAEAARARAIEREELAHVE
jgi:uncharacterized protein (UPF0276 family)